LKKQEVRATQTKEINRGFLVLWWDGVLKKTRPNIASRHLVWKSEKKNRRNMIRKTQNQTYKKWTTLSMSTLNHNFTKLKKKGKKKYYSPHVPSKNYQRPFWFWRTFSLKTQIFTYTNALKYVLSCHNPNF